MIELAREESDKLSEAVDWNFDMIQEVVLGSPDDFLKIKETLTRIGITVKGENTLNQSCHILHKKGKYYIVSFLEVFALDGKQVNMKISDIARRNTIAQMLESWGLCRVVENLNTPQYKIPISGLKVIAYREKANWHFVSRCKLGK